MQTISPEIKQLLADQKMEWELAAKNFAGLEQVLVREFQFDGFVIKVQFNPGRIVSSAAKVDKKSIDERPCFLCEKNRLKEQRGVDFGDYSILVNPFPIFPEHFTIPDLKHVPQRIKGNFKSMLDISKAMEGFTLFYNGPKCGASAPDHFHFQAGNNGFMPLDDEIDVLKDKYGKQVLNAELDVWAIKDGLRNFLALESGNKESLVSGFETIYQTIDKLAPVEEEPMMNILASFSEGKWRVLIFPRALHRPLQYFEEGDKNILLSPASVDMGGVLITPLEKDFTKIRKEDIESIFSQVLWSEDEFDKLTELLHE